MPELKNFRHERFAQNIAKGMNSGTGYTAAGYKATRHSAEVAASRLLKNDDIRARIAELTAPALAKTETTVERVLQELAYLAFYDVTQILDTDDRPAQVLGQRSWVFHRYPVVIGLENLRHVVEGEASQLL